MLRWAALYAQQGYLKVEKAIIKSPLIHMETCAIEDAVPF
jgi:hypothetical protein